jgi:hypothetical protein
LFIETGLEDLIETGLEDCIETGLEVLDSVWGDVVKPS